MVFGLPLLTVTLVAGVFLVFVIALVIWGLRFRGEVDG